jgi:hypothetical protein
VGEVGRGASGLCPRAAAVARGWWLEAILAFGVGLLWRLGEHAGGPGGGVVVLALLAVAVGSKRQARRWLKGGLREASTRRWFARALRLCAVRGPAGALPVVRSLEPVPVGLQVRLQVPPGCHTGVVLAAAPALAATLGVREVRVNRDPADASLAHVIVVLRDPLASGGPLACPWEAASRITLWRPVPIGLDEDGRLVELSLAEHHLLLGGEPGAG